MTPQWKCCRYANWIAAPKIGIDNRGGDIEYVKIHRGRGLRVLPRIVDARHAGDYRVSLRFADGLSGEVDLADELWATMFEPLKDMGMFAQVRLDGDLDTIVWPNGADLPPQWLHDQLSQKQRAAAAELWDQRPRLPASGLSSEHDHRSV
jgi:hypothetical protein